MARTGRLTRYVLSELWTPTLLSIALWVSLILMNQFFLLAQMALRQNLPASTIFVLLLLNIPKCLLLALPMGTLLGALLGVGRLSADHEVIAMNGAGLGPGFLVRPMAIHGVVFTVLALLVYWIALPASVLKIREVNARMVRSADLVNELRPRVFFTQFPGYVVFVNEIDPKRLGVVSRLLLYKSEGGGREQLIVAKSATVSRDGSQLGAFRVDCREGVLHDFKTSSPESYRPLNFRRYVPPSVAPPSYLLGNTGAASRSPSDMGPGQLFGELREARSDPDPFIRPARVRFAQVEIQARLALPFSCLLFSLLALPLGITRVRSGKGAGFALSIGIILGYWLIYTSLRNQAFDGRLPVVAAVWAANGATAAVALGTYLRFGRRSGGWLRDRLRGIARRVSRLWPRRESGSIAATRPAAEGWIPRIDRYVGMAFLRFFATSLAFCWLVTLLLEVKSVVDGLAKDRASSAEELARYFLLFTPGSLGLSLPIAALLGAVITCTLFGRNGELTAMKATGMSARRVAASIFLLTIVLGIAAFLVQDRIAPETNARAQVLKDELQGRAPRTYAATPGGRWIFGTEGRLYHYRIFDPELRRFQGLSVYSVDFESPRIGSHAFAGSVRWDGSHWRAESGWARTFPVGEAVGEFRRLAPDEILSLDPPDHFARRERTVLRESDLPDQMSLGDLGAQIRVLANSGFDTTRLRVDWHVKLARAATPLVMVLLGLPFAFRVGRRGSMYGVGVALLLVLAYWAVFAISNALGLEAALAPAVAAWAPNVLFAGLGAWMLATAQT